MPSPDPTGAEPDLAAAELALGVLDGDARATALRRALADPVFAAEVEWWRGTLAELFAGWPEIAPPTELARRIEATLDGPARALRRWRALAVAASTLAASLGLLLLRPEREPPAPAAPDVALVAALAAPQGPALTAVYRPAAGTLRIVGPVRLAAGRTAQLWVIGGDGAPYSLGLVPSGSGAVRLTGDARPRLRPGATIAVSDEAAGGSPGPGPTGPVIASGPLLGA